MYLTSESNYGKSNITNASRSKGVILSDVINIDNYYSVIMERFVYLCSFINNQLLLVANEKFNDVFTVKNFSSRSIKKIITRTWVGSNHQPFG